jgi:putative sterol carrier protein
LDADDMRTIFVGLLPLLPHYVDPEGAAGFTASFDIRLRGDPNARGRFEFDAGRLTVRQGDAGKVDCRVSADPATFVLILYGRSNLLRPVLTGRVFASGRKPWLGLTLPGRFRRP